MDIPPDDDNAAEVELLYEVRQENAWIEQDVVQVSTTTWAIHGVIPVDGDVLLAEFESYDAAKRIIDQLCGAPRPDRQP